MLISFSLNPDTFNRNTENIYSETKMSAEHCKHPILLQQGSHLEARHWKKGMHKFVIPLQNDHDDQRRKKSSGQHQGSFHRLLGPMCHRLCPLGAISGHHCHLPQLI